MIYNSAVEQIKGAKTAQSESMLPVMRLATVTSLSGDRALIQFYGEDTPSSKLYPYVSGYKPTENDVVLVLQQGSTYIIAGKISKTAVGDAYHLTKTQADSLYQAKGSTTGVDRLVSNGKELVLTAVTLDPSENGTFYLGSANKKYKTMYVTNWEYQQGYGIRWNNKNYIEPYYPSGQRIILGTQSNPFGLVAYGIDMYGNIIPMTSNSYDLGSNSYRFRNAYAKQFYQNGTAISTSDRRKKTGIKEIGRKYLDFFRKLKPRLFKFKDGDSGRLHCGFIAQDVEEAAGECEIDSKDLAFLCIDEEGNYGLRYEELIALQTKVIQDLQARVEALEEIVKGGNG